MGLSGRVAFVTGASQGIGRACAVKLASAGATVALGARNREKLDEVAKEIAAAGGKAEVFPLDVGDEEQIKATFKAALGQLGKIDVLVNNAGITRDQLVMRMKRADWDAVLNTNLTSAYLCIQQVIGPMLKHRWGRIINVTSIFGQMGQAGQANYAASKAGLIGLTMAIAREVGSRSITCNAIAPGFIETAMTSVLSDEFKQTALKNIPLARLGTAEDVANSVAFLSSDEASYITGHVLNVNGGMLMDKFRPSRERPSVNSEDQSRSKARAGASDFSIHPAESPTQIAQARELFVEYAETLGFSLCFQSFDQELETLPGNYAPPHGRLLLAEYEGELAGCVALRRIDPEIAEMKRLYLRPKFRGKGMGRILAEHIIREARAIGYRRMRLDTVEPVMRTAVSMYREFGFYEIEPYTKNPMEGALYMELKL